MTQQFLIDQGNLVKPQVELVGQDGNAFAIIGRIMNAWKRAGRSDIAEEFRSRAASGDYNNLLAVAMEYIDEEAAWGEEEEEDPESWNPYADEEEDEEEA